LGCALGLKVAADTQPVAISHEWGYAAKGFVRLTNNNMHHTIKLED